MPGDTHRNLQVDADYSAQTFKHILVPVWLLAYNYGARTFQVLVNGYTGRIAGEQPYSWVKIALAVLAVLIVLMIIAWLQETPPGDRRHQARRRQERIGVPVAGRSSPSDADELLAKWQASS